MLRNKPFLSQSVVFWWNYAALSINILLQYVFYKLVMNSLQVIMWHSEASFFKYCQQYLKTFV